MGRTFPNMREIVQMGATFLLVLLAWIFFRAESLFQAFQYLGKIFSSSFFSSINLLPLKFLLIISIFLMVEWFQREKQHALSLHSSNLPKLIRWLIYYGIIIIISKYSGIKQDFIYFQF